MPVTAWRPETSDEDWFDDVVRNLENDQERME